MRAKRPFIAARDPRKLALKKKSEIFCTLAIAVFRPIYPVFTAFSAMACRFRSVSHNSSAPCCRMLTVVFRRLFFWPKDGFC
jgi:hypothetical protein